VTILSGVDETSEDMLTKIFIYGRKIRLTNK